MSDAINCARSAPNRTETTIDGATQLPKLKALSLTIGNLNGRFPYNFGWLNSPLTTLVLKSTRSTSRFAFDGSIPESFRVLHQLETLHFTSLALESTEAGALSQPHALKSLSLVSMQRLTANLNAYVRSASATLTFLEVTGSDMVELSSAAVQDCHLLEYIDISATKGMPWYLDSQFWRSLPNLKYFDASSTRTTGSITPEIGMMTGLQVLLLSRTRITGSIPPEIGSTALVSLSLGDMLLNGPIPDQFALLNSTLQYATLSDMKLPQSLAPTLPEWFSAFTKLERLDLSACGYHGTIPSSYGRLANLTHLNLRNNRLDGTIPEVVWPNGFNLDLSSNNLTGTIPRSVIQGARFLYLRQNSLGPSIPEGAMGTGSNIMELDLSHNAFSGSLPEADPTRLPYQVDLSYNTFNGTIPTSYCGMEDLKLNNNNLIGSPAPLFNHSCTKASQIYLSDNHFNGSFPNVQRIESLTHLEISYNKFTDDVPIPPPNIKFFYASHNHFSMGTLWPQVLPERPLLEYLDLSHNGFSSIFSWQSFVTPNLKLLSLAHNTLGIIEQLKIATYSLTSLDITNTKTSKAFEAGHYHNLNELRLADNLLSGDIDFAAMPLLSQLDISNNHYSFDVAIFSDLPLLSFLNARSNQLYGALVFNGLPRLKSVDLSDNNLDWIPDFGSVGTSFRNDTLQTLNISKNNIPIIQRFDTEHTGLARGESSAPSLVFPKLLTCYDLTFYGAIGRTFIYSEDQFAYHQCDCNSAHFGLPPHNCHACPYSGTYSCGANETTIMKNYYAFIAPPNTTDPPSPTTARWTPTFVSLLWDSVVGSSIQSAHNQLGNDSRLQTEPCLSSVIQSLSGRSDCRGVQITAAHVTTSNMSVTKLLATQCSDGSEGRLCSRCTCDTAGEGECWYPRGPICARCSRVFRRSQSLPLLVAMVFVLLVVLSIVMLLVLRSKRKQRLTPWKHLSLGRRIFYRLLHVVSLGNVSILVTFLQILTAFTNWDASLRVQFLGVLNGDVERFVPNLLGAFWPYFCILTYND